ncbi:hypothetical protein BGZ80_006741, partial [Entomortierella chlamydospora]
MTPSASEDSWGARSRRKDQQQQEGPEKTFHRREDKFDSNISLAINHACILRGTHDSERAGKYGLVTPRQTSLLLRTANRVTSYLILVYNISDLCQALSISRIRLTAPAVVSNNDYGKNIYSLGPATSFSIIKTIGKPDVRQTVNAYLEDSKVVLKNTDCAIFSPESEYRHVNYINNKTFEHGSRLDVIPDILVVKNGALELETGVLRASLLEDLMTRQLNAEYNDMEFMTNLIDKFISDLFDNDQEVIQYLQHPLGYGITGSTESHLWAIFTGEGSNGKLLLVELLEHLLEDWVVPAPDEIFFKSSRTSHAHSHSTHLETLKGARICIKEEADQNGKLNT